MRRILMKVVFVFALVFPSIGADAGELMSLEDWLNLPRERQEPSYLFVRCSALYFGLAQYAGAENLGEKTTKDYAQAIANLQVSAIIVRRERTPNLSIAVASKQVEQERNRIAKLYTDRMAANYAASGEAFASDEVIRGDMQICKAAVAASSKHSGQSN